MVSLKLTAVAVFLFISTLGILMTSCASVPSENTTSTPHHSHHHRHHHRHHHHNRSHPAEHAPMCQDLTEEELTKLADEVLILNLRHGLHESFYQVPAVREACQDESLEHFRKTSGSFIQVTRSNLENDPDNRQTCNVADESNGPYTTVSDPCPLRWVVNADPNRIPKVLLEAQCLPCPCMLSFLQPDTKLPEEAEVADRDSESTSETLLPVPDRSNCSAVYYYTKVLRKSAECNANGKFRYLPVWEPITVGCACRGAPSIPTPSLPQARTHSVSSSSNGGRHHVGKRRFIGGRARHTAAVENQV